MTTLTADAFAYGVLAVTATLEQLNEALVICRDSRHECSNEAADLIKAELERRATEMALAAGAR